MKYALFAGQDYYPKGGIQDLVGLFETKEEAIEASKYKYCFVKPKIVRMTDGAAHNDYRLDVEWWHIVNTDTFEIIHQGNQDE